ncbi:MAG: membrane protein insertion efficiency factor YidD [bacterium]|nr:membrane protein insertion efficiency factor YidD [bacterium]
MIQLYQRTLSPDHGPLRLGMGRCKYRPTCSEYAVQAIERCGLLRGGLKACWRILRCNPFSNGGWDPPVGG